VHLTPAVQPSLPPRGVVYEVDLDADADIEGPFDTWLRDHIADMLQFDGFRSAEILEDSAAPAGRIRRIVQYRLRDQAALDDYLRNHASRMRAAGVARFGNRFTAERRVLPHREEFVRGAVSTENCLNCGEVLTGQHCSHCGQPARVRVLSLWGLVKDVIGDVLDADSRVWRTLRPLAFRPGLLTQEFLRGRRATYTPPFRMYLVLSLVFFVLANVGERAGEGLKFSLNDAGERGFRIGAEVTPDDGTAAQAPQAADQPAPKARPAKLDPETQALVDAIVARLPESEQARGREGLEQELSQLTPEQLEPVKQVLNDPCGEASFKIEGSTRLERYEPRLRSACRKILEDQQSFGRALFQNVPKMMFIFLPLIAAIMAVLYVRSGRYYVEHLLFVVHFHAFFFLVGIVVIVLERLVTATPAGPLATGLTVVQGATGVVLGFYVPAYLLRAMRRVYEQSWWKTVPKFAMLCIAYLTCLVITAVGLLFYTALTL